MALRDAGHRLALLSNSTPEDVGPRLKSLDLHRFFDHVHEIVPPKRKPQSEVFLETVRELGLAPEEAVMVGNDLESDILPALAAGYGHGIWLTRRTKPCQPAVTLVRGPRDVVAAINRLWNKPRV